MKLIYKILVSLLILFLGSLNSILAQTSRVNAGGQDYNTALGVRLGGLTSGITFKHFVNPQGAIEGIASFGYRTFVLTGLYEHHENIINSPGLRWFYGGGAHLGFFQYGGYYYFVHRDGNYIYVDRYGDSAAIFGLDFILGLDYKFNNAPFDISLDMKPIIDFYNGLYGYFDGGISFRFTF